MEGQSRVGEVSSKVQEQLKRLLEVRWFKLPV